MQPEISSEIEGLKTSPAYGRPLPVINGAIPLNSESTIIYKRDIVVNLMDLNFVLLNFVHVGPQFIQVKLLVELAYY